MHINPTAVSPETWRKISAFTQLILKIVYASMIAQLQSVHVSDLNPSNNQHSYSDCPE